MVEKYISRPIFVEAIKYDGNNYQEILDFAEGKVRKIESLKNLQNPGALIGPGGVILRGCYVAKDQNGDIRIYSDQTFFELFTIRGEGTLL